MLDKEKVIVLVDDIKRKKELQGIEDNFVAEYIQKYLRQEQKAAKALQENFNSKSKAYKAVLKAVRSQLRRVYGLFRDESAKRKRLIEELLKALPQKRPDLIKQILSTHSSTQERLSFYEKLYEKIFIVTGKPRIILDLGCGINPFAVPYMKLKECTYYAYDLNEEEMESITKFFQLLSKENPSFSGKAIVADILKEKLPQADICFLFKMTDVLDRGKGHKTTEELLQKIPAKFVIISFATKTMSGKEMTAPGRRWMEWLCKRLGYEYTILEFPNELFYVIEK